MAQTGTDISTAATILKNNGLVAIPTETVYGLAGNALSDTAVLKIFKAKKRPSFDPLIAHIGDPDHLQQLVDDIPTLASEIIREYWPGPLTVLLPKKKHVPDLLTSGLDRVAVRVPKHPLTLELLQAVDFPLAAPSANPFGYISPTKASHVADQLGDQVDYILDGGKTPIGIESTIIGFERGTIIVYRLGGISTEQLETFGRVKLQLNQNSNPAAPGMMKSHYAPKTKLLVENIPMWLATHKSAKVAILSFEKKYPEQFQNIVLSTVGNLDEAARKLFSALRDLDHSGADLILTEKFPEKGIGRAINDRLKRAAAR